MPDERWGEAPHAFVVLEAGATATETEPRNYARPSRKAAGHFQTVTNSDLRLQTSDSEHEHEQEQERCIRASSVLCPLSADLYCYVRAAENSHRQGPEVCPSRQARDFEAVTGLTM